MSDEIEALGAFATAGLIVKSATRRTGVEHDDGDHPTHCANCQAPLSGPYCAACGQRAHSHRSLMHMGEELVHGIAHFDGKIWRTLPLLAFKPGKLTRDYIDGKRATYVSPMGLFLFVIFLMFLVFSFAPHKSADASSYGGIIADTSRAAPKTKAAVMDAFRAQADMARAKLASDVAAGKDPILAAERVSAWEAASGATDQSKLSKDIKEQAESGGLTINTGIPDLDIMAKRMAKNPELLIYKLKNTAYKFSFLLVPISLPFIWLMFFWRRDLAMYDHAVFSLYSLSFMSLLFTLAAVLNGIDRVPTAIVALLVCLAPPIHMYKQLKYTYDLSRAGAAIRTFLLLFFSAIALTLFAVAIFAMGVSE